MQTPQWHISRHENAQPARHVATDDPARGGALT
jgi:hypothetical protein